MDVYSVTEAMLLRSQAGYPMNVRECIALHASRRVDEAFHILVVCKDEEKIQAMV